MPHLVFFFFRLYQGYRTYGTHFQNNTREDFLGKRHFLLSIFFLSFTRPACLYIVNNICVCVCVCVCIYIYIYIYIYISDCVETAHALQLLPNNTIVKHFYTNRSGVKCSLDIYLCGAVLTVTGTIHDIGQKVLQCSIQIGNSSSSPGYCNIVFLSAFFEEAFITNII